MICKVETGLTLFEILNYILGFLLLFLVVRYLWIVLILKEDDPSAWRQARKEGKLTPFVKKLKRSYSDEVRFLNWWLQAERLKRENIPGAFVELGVYKGESARILHAIDPSRRFHLFDTFTGFPAEDLEAETGEAAAYTPQHFADTSPESVLRTIRGNHNIILHPGHFPESAAGFHEMVALVNLDADLYDPTKAALELFYPLLVPGGIILVHDYNDKWPGVIRAVDEFTRTIPEQMILLPDTQGTAMIIRNKI